MYDLFVIFITEIYMKIINVNCIDTHWKLSVKISDQLFQIFTLEVHVNEYECTFKLNNTRRAYFFFIHAQIPYELKMITKYRSCLSCPAVWQLRRCTICMTEWWSSVTGARDSQTERDTWHSGITDPNKANVLQMLWDPFFKLLILSQVL